MMYTKNGQITTKFLTVVVMALISSGIAGKRAELFAQPRLEVGCQAVDPERSSY